MTSSFGPARSTTIRHHHANRVILVPRAEGLSGSGIALSEAEMGEVRDEVRGRFEHLQQVAEPRLRDRKLVDIFRINGRREREQAVRHGYFRRLDGIAAYTVDFARSEQRNDVLNSLDGLIGDEIEVIEDFALGLPPTLPPDELTLSSDHRQDGRWPEASGIAAAHGDGVRGANIAFGMLDTGIDADHCEFNSRTVNFRYLPLRFEQPHRDVRGFDVSGHGTHVAGNSA